MVIVFITRNGVLHTHRTCYELQLLLNIGVQLDCNSKIESSVQTHHCIELRSHNVYSETDLLLYEENPQKKLRYTRGQQYRLEGSVQVP